MSVRVLCVNLGSRTAKLTVLDVAAGSLPGRPQAPLAEIDRTIDELGAGDLLGTIPAGSIDAVAYRVVRVAELPAADCVPFDDRLRAAILASYELAPLHTKAVVDASDALRRALPGARHVAVFDAAFHRTIPDRAAAYGLPYADFAAGWRKVGYHGLSHAYAAARVAVLLGDAEPRRNLVSAHLGGGASIAAIAGARSVDTSMGFTPVDGLVMSTRAGSIDAGMLLAYMRRKGLDAEAAEHLLSHECGLLGLGGFADMRDILAARARGEAGAILAFDVFVYRIATAIGAAAAALGGIDALAFLGGIGENAAAVRASACAPLGFLGIAVDPERNAAPAGDALLSPPDAAVPVVRVHTREDWIMALAGAA